MSVGDAYELRGEDPETIKQLVEDVRSGAAPNLKAAMRQRGIEGEPRQKDLRNRAKVALGGHAVVEGSSIDEGAPWPAEGGVLWLTGERGLDSMVERVVDCVKRSRPRAEWPWPAMRK